MNRFTGSVTNKMDAKGRVSVPAEFREILKNSGSAAFIARPSTFAPSIECAPLEQLEQDILTVKQTAAPLTLDQRRLRLRLFGTAKTLNFDPEGRVLLPEAFIQHARLSLKSEVLFIGLYETFEIWEPEAGRAVIADSMKSDGGQGDGGFR